MNFRKAGDCRSLSPPFLFHFPFFFLSSERRRFLKLRPVLGVSSSGLLLIGTRVSACKCHNLIGSPSTFLYCCVCLHRGHNAREGEGFTVSNVRHVDCGAQRSSSAAFTSPDKSSGMLDRCAETVFRSHIRAGHIVELSHLLVSLTFVLPQKR